MNEEVDFSINDILNEAWSFFKAHAFPVVALISAPILVAVGFGMLGGILTVLLGKDSSITTIVTGLLSIIRIVLSLIIGIGSTKSLFMLLDGEEVNSHTLFSAHGVGISYVIGNLIRGVVLIVGYILLIIPGIILQIRTGFMNYLIIDRNVSGTEAFQMSMNLTQGIGMKLFVWALVSLGINFVGLLLLGVGLIVTIPLTSLGHMLIYRKVVAVRMATIAVPAASPPIPVTPPTTPAV